MRPAETMRSILHDRRGVSAVEFAILAPILMLAFLAMVDVGMAIGERMEMDRNVRAGAQAAMSLNNDEVDIRQIVIASADSRQDLDVSVVKSCLCDATSAGCTDVCGSGQPPSVFFDIGATLDYAGIILPPRTLSSRTQVQIR